MKLLSQRSTRYTDDIVCIQHWSAWPLSFFKSELKSPDQHYTEDILTTTLQCILKFSYTFFLLFSMFQSIALFHSGHLDVIVGKTQVLLKTVTTALLHSQIMTVWQWASLNNTRTLKLKHLNEIQPPFIWHRHIHCCTFPTVTCQKKVHHTEYTRDHL